MGYANIQADSNFYRQSLNADGIKYVTGPYTSLYEDVFRAVTVTSDSVVSVTSYVGDSLSSEFLLAGTEIYGLFSSVTIHSGKAVLHLAGASYISEIINQYSASGIPLGFYEEGTQCLSQKISALLTQGVFDDASWVMVPSQYKEDTVRAFRPTSELGNLAFTRASDATFTDSTGVVRRSPYNLLQFSEQFDNAAWSKVNSTISPNATIAPNGSLTADSLFETSANGQHLVRQPLTVIVGRSYKISAYVKKNGRDWCIVVAGAGGNGYYFNISNGTIGSETGGTGAVSNPQIQAVGDDWYLVSYTLIAGSTTQGIEIFTSTGNGNFSFLGDVTKGLFIWGAQLVEGTSALPYFPTTDRLNVPRLDYRNADGTLSTCPRLLLEPQRTNSIRNSSMVGAVAGTPGTLPTNWTSSLRGLTQTIVASGTINGLPYIDIRFFGTSTGGPVQIFPDSLTQIVAAVGQSWTGSVWIQALSQPLPATGYNCTLAERTAAGSPTGSSSVSFGTTFTRVTLSRLLTGATSERVSWQFHAETNAATAYDFTIRIAAPQMELGGSATTWVPTTTAAVTRIAEVASNSSISSFIGGTSGTWLIELDTRSTSLSGTNAVIGVAGGGKNVGIANTGSQSSFRLNVNGITDTISQNITTKFKIAISFDPSGVVCFVDGSQKTLTNTSTQILSGLTDISFSTGTRFEYINLHQSAFFPTRLDNTTLAALTTL